MTVWCDIANEQYGTRFKMEDLDSWSWWRKSPISKDDFYRILDESWDCWEKIPPTEPDIARKVARIESFGDLDVVTGRSKRTAEAARNWIDFQKVRYRNFVRVLGWRDKILLDYDVYIDDAPDLMPLVSRSPAAWALLYDRPWNRNVQDLPKILRTKSWTSIPRLLKQVQTRRNRTSTSLDHSIIHDNMHENQ